MKRPFSLTQPDTRHEAAAWLSRGAANPAAEYRSHRFLNPGIAEMTAGQTAATGGKIVTALYFCKGADNGTR